MRNMLCRKQRLLIEIWKGDGRERDPDRDGDRHRSVDRGQNRQ